MTAGPAAARARLAAGLALAFTLLAPATHAAPHGSLDASMPDAQTVELRLDGALSGAEAASARHLADQDGDGAVNATEAAAAQRDGLAAARRVAGLGGPLGRVLVAGAPPSSSSVEDLQYTGLEGRVDGVTSVGVAWRLRFGYPAGNGTDLVVRLDYHNATKAGFVPMEVLRLSFTPPPGYAIAGTGNLPLSGRVGAGGARLDLPAGAGRDDPPLDILLAPGAPDSPLEAPTPAAPVLALAVLAAASAYTRGSSSEPSSTPIKAAARLPGRCPPWILSSAASDRR